MSKVLWHLGAFLMAVFIVIVTVFLGQDFLKYTVYYHDENQLVEEDFIYEPNYESNHVNISVLQRYLSTGRIVIFGSSEITANSHKYIPQNFFNQELDIDLTAFGHAGQQCLAILSQLAAYYNKELHNNAKIVIILSPGWFDTKRTSMSSFLEYMPQRLLEKLYFKSEVGEKYKLWISRYLKKNIHKIKQPSAIHYIVSNYNPNHSFSTLLQELPYKVDFLIKRMLFGNEGTLQGVVPKTYQTVSTDWENWSKEAFEIEKSKVTTNHYSINDPYFNQYVKPEIAKGKFPFKVRSVPEVRENEEYQDFLRLVKFGKLLKTKPLFIMQNLNPHAYQELEKYHDILNEIKTTLESNGFEYLDMWSWNKKDYVDGSLTDVMHMGELGWVQVDKAIYDYFIQGKMKNENDN